MALSTLPKSLAHAQLDPLSYRQRGLLREEALLVVKIGIALLATSLALGRGGAALREADLAAIQTYCRHLADRLHRLRGYFANSRPVPATAPGPVLAIDDAAPASLAAIMEELRAIEEWLDELEPLLKGYSAAAFVPNRLRAKRG